MEARRFDAVTKALGNDRTRRRVLRGLVAGIGGGALIGLTGGQASADKCCKELHKSLKADCRACGGHLSKFDCGKTEAPGTCGALSECSGCDEEAATQDGAADGRLGGRHGPNRRGRDRDRDRHRSHGHKKGNKKGNKKKDQAGVRFRDCSQVPIVPGADLSGCNLPDADLSGVDLTGANLFQANLARADLFDATLIRANLSGAILAFADLVDAKLNDAKLIGANLKYANLTQANLDGADLTGARFCHTTMPSGGQQSGDCP